MTNTVQFLPAVGGDNSIVTDDTSPTTGLGNGGHRTRFVPALAQIVAIAQFIVNAAAAIPNSIFLACRGVTTSNDTLSGLAARDGITPIAGQRWLVTGQTAGADNGIYLAAAGAWSRAADANVSASFSPKKLVAVSEGTLSAGSFWYLSNAGAITLGTTALTFATLPSKSLANIWAAAQTFNGAATFNAATTYNASLNMVGAAINEAYGANIASATSVNLDNATGNVLDITGTAPIATFVLALGSTRTVRFKGVLLLTNSTGLALQGGANITTAVDDMAIVRGTSAGVQILYFPKNGLSVVAPSLSGRLLRVTSYRTGGFTGTFAKQADTSFIIVKAQAAGGSGGGAAAVAGAAGSGGSAGAYFEGLILASNLAASEPIEVGNGGASQAAGQPGFPGGRTLFGAVQNIIQANGGGGGTQGSSASTCVGGPSGGIITPIGTNVVTIKKILGSYGGASVSTSAAATAVGGVGGSAPSGGAGGQAIATTGTALPGDSGGGGAGAKGATASSGGAGGDGWLIIEEYSI